MAQIPAEIYYEYLRHLQGLFYVINYCFFQKYE